MGQFKVRVTSYWGNFKLTAPPVGQFRVFGGAIHKWGNFQPYLKNGFSTIESDDLNTAPTVVDFEIVKFSAYTKKHNSI